MEPPLENVNLCTRALKVAIKKHLHMERVDFEKLRYASEYSSTGILLIHVYFMNERFKLPVPYREVQSPEIFTYTFMILE